MRATRAYIASLGTTGLLLASAGSLLLVVSALFAFNAWPGSTISDAVDSVFVNEDGDRLRLSGPEQVALDAAPAAVAIAPDGDGAPAGDGGTPGAANTGDGGGGTGPGGSDGGFEGGGGNTGGGGNPPTTTDPGNGQNGTDVPLPSVDTTDATDDLADTTEEATRNLGNGVGQVNPQLGDAVSDTGEALSDIVRDLPDVQVGGGDSGLTIKIGQ